MLFHWRTQADRQAGRQAARTQTDRPTDRHTSRQTERREDPDFVTNKYSDAGKLSGEAWRSEMNID